MNEDRCVMCGEIIPEGQQVCPSCEDKVIPKTDTQCDRLLRLMDEVEWVDQVLALREIGCMRLASRVSDLKKMGYAVEGRMKEVKNRWGEPCYVKEYRLNECVK